MAADTALLLSLVEEYVSGLQDSKAKDTAKGKQSLSRFLFHLRRIAKKALSWLLSCRFEDAQHEHDG